MNTRWTTTLSIIYIIILSWILLLKLGVHFTYMTQRNFNLVPYLHMNRMEVILNVIVFIPVGIYAGLLFKTRSILNQFLICGTMSFLFESIQFIFRIGAFDVTDLIDNSLGGLLGIWFYRLLTQAFRNGLTLQKTINTIATVCTILLIAFLVMLKMDLLPIKYL